MTNQMVFAKVNGWEDTLMAQKWGIRGYPTLILMKSDGTEIDRVPGYMPAPEFVQTMDDFTKGIGTLNDLLAKLSDHPDSLQLYMKIGEKYQYRAKDSLADSYYRKVLEMDPKNKSDLADDAAFNIAMNRFYAGEARYDDAIAAFNDVIKLFPKSDMAAESATYVPYILNRQGKKDEALKLYKQFLIDYPQSEEVDWVKGQIQQLSKPS